MPAINAADFELAAGEVFRFEAEVQVERSGARVVIRIQALPRIGFHLRQCQIAGQLVINHVVSGAERDAGDVFFLPAEAAARAPCGVGAAVAIATGFVALHIRCIIHAVGAALRSRAQIQRAIAAHLHAGRRHRLRRALPCDDVDDTGGRIVAIERALAAAQHLDALDVRERNLQPVKAGHVRAVQPLAVEQHQHTAEAVLAEAAHGNFRLCRVAGRRTEFDATDVLERVHHIRGAGRLDVLGRDDRDVLRHFRLRAPGAAGGDDNFLGGIRRRRG